MANGENRSLRLTLRTLLAWLDDQLPAEDVREIGQKVAESPVAQSLKEKIQKVTRRRRLLVPASTGADSTDPNLVASYLDNELSPEKVAEYEEKCLKSDVDLAEVASCHQILSMIGQKAKVPPEARYRMYRLVKGREAVGPDVPRAFAPPPPEPAAKPIPQWAPPSGAGRRSLIERFGPPAAVAALMLLMGLSAWMMLPDTPPGPVGSPAQRASGQPVAGGRAADAPSVKPGTPRPDLVAGPSAAGPALDAAVAGPTGEPAAEAASTTDTAEPSAEVAGGFGTVVDLHDGLLLRWSAEPRSWIQVAEGAPLIQEDRLVAIAPFRPAFQMGPVRARLVGPSAVHLLRPAPEEVARLALGRGRVVLRSEAPAALSVMIEGQAVRLNLPAGLPVGLERVDNWPAGADEPSAPSLTVYAPEGQVGLNAGGAAETLAGPGSIAFRVPARFTDATSEASPAWITAETAPEVDLLTGQELLAHFGPDVSTTRALVEAIEDDSPNVRGLAVLALGILGEIDLVMAAMTRPEDPAARRAAIDALRAYAAASPVTARDLRDQLAQYNGAEWAAIVYKLLAGYTPRAAQERATYAQLVGFLENPDVVIRELALDQLTTLTGRDALEYDPDQPIGPGLDAWRDLLQRGELPPGGDGADDASADDATAAPSRPPAPGRP